MKKVVPIIIVSVVLVGAGAFWAGMKYDQAQTAARFSQRFQGNGSAPGNGRAAGNGVTAGQIISKDSQSLTVKLRDGGSKIVFLSGSTEISKFAAGSTDDLSVGQTVTVTGQANADGSLTAQTIQIRPALPSPTPTP